MAAAAALEAPVRPVCARRGSFLAASAALAIAAAGPAVAATQVMVVAGLGGDPQFDERFANWSRKVEQASATTTGDTERVLRLSGESARREAIQTALQGAAKTLRAGDQFVLVLLGHGSFDGSEYRLNIAGPDITGSEILSLLDKLPEGVAQLVVNATSTSGAVAEKWAKAGRVVITATRSGGERNATRFGGYWADALVNQEADTDKDGAVTAQEAYDFAVRKVADSYKSDSAVLTERARISGNDAGRFVVARLGAAALFASDAQLIAFREEQARIELRLGEVKARKSALAEDDYYNQLEPVLIDLARLGQRIDARLAALGVSAGGDTDAKP